MVWGRGSEKLHQKQPGSDVPELAGDIKAEDREVVQAREKSLDQERLREELGFASVESMKVANDKLVQIAKEKDAAKMEKLKAELKTLMDDGDMEPSSASTAPSLDVVLARAAKSRETAEAAERERVAKIPKREDMAPPDSDMERMMWQREKELSAELLARVHGLEVADPKDADKFEQWKQEIPQIQKELTKVRKSGETGAEEYGRKEFHDAETAIYAPEDTDITEAPQRELDPATAVTEKYAGALEPDDVATQLEGAPVAHELDEERVVWSFQADGGTRVREFIASHPVEGFVSDQKLVAQVENGEMTLAALQQKEEQNRSAYEQLVDTVQYYKPDIQLPAYEQAMLRPEATVENTMRKEFGVVEDLEHRQNEIAVDLADRFQHLVFTGETLRAALNELMTRKQEQSSDHKAA